MSFHGSVKFIVKFAFQRDGEAFHGQIFHSDLVMKFLDSSL